MFRPTIEEVKAMSAEYGNIPVSCAMYADVITPVALLRKIKKAGTRCCILESMEDSGRWGRYTFIGFDPRLEFTCSDGEATIRNGSAIRMPMANPDSMIRHILNENKSPRFDYLPPFTGGLAGYFSYDYIKYCEPTLKLKGLDTEGQNDVCLMLFDKIVAFDNLKQQIILIVNMKTDSPEENYEHALRELRKMEEIIVSGQACEPEPLRIKSEFRSLFDEEAFCGIVRKAKEYILEGDIFQAVLSDRFEADAEGSLLDAYRVLRTTNPSPYMFYFSCGDMEIAGASPETLVKLEDGKLSTFPLAGTRPRGRSYEEDAALERELLSDPKELAEHNMLVDLGRNDLGRISEFGSVKVEKYMSIEKFSHVMHIGSAVSSRIRKDKGALDAIRAVLPAGTLSGAPKIRACEIIDSLENDKRGVYGGAIGYLDFTGNMDTCIAIRIAYMKNGKVVVRSGAGIVADSVPEKEYRECVNKAMAVMDALRISDGGID
jgi:anthranilate synthase component 1